MEHSFNTEHAEKFGILEAVLINNFQFWIAKNIANETNFYDNRYWTYNSVKAYRDLFPYATIDKVRRAIEKLVDNGVLIKGCYNKDQRDRTSWYSLSDEYLPTMATNRMQLANLPNAKSKAAKPLPDNKTSDNKLPYVITPQSPQGVVECEEAEVEEVKPKPYAMERSVFDEFRRIYRGSKRGNDTEFDNFVKKHKDWRTVLPNLRGLYENQCSINDERSSKGLFVPQPKNLQTYINNRCWEDELTTENYATEQLSWRDRQEIAKQQRTDAVLRRSMPGYGNGPLTQQELEILGGFVIK